MVLMLCGGLQTPCPAQEIVPFRLVGVDGHISTGYDTDEFATQQPSVDSTPPATQRQKQSAFRSEIFLMTHSYVYHPGFLALDVGGGPVFTSGHALSDGMVNRSQKTLYNFTAHATLLADKPVRGAVFYEHLNPTQSLSPGEIFIQQTEKYGFSLSLLAPVTPVPLNLEVTRLHDKGSSFERLVDDRTDRVALRLDRALWTFGTTQFNYNAQQQVSSSGSANLPIQNSRQDSQSLGADTYLKLGKDRKYDLTNNISYTRQKYTLAQGKAPKLDDFRFFLSYRGFHSSEWQTFADYQFTSNRQDERATLVNSANAGASWSTVKNVGLNASLHNLDTRAAQFKNTTRGVDGSLQYARSLPLGTGQASYALRYDQRAQTATGTNTTIIGERVVLSGTTPVALAQARVTTGSVVVRNTQRTQIYTEGIDYVLTVVGNSTRIQNVLSGSILNGEVVLADYAFDIGGTYGSTQLDQNLNFNWAPSRFLNVYLRYADSAPRVTSGMPTTPLNAVKSTLYGARADVPLGFSVDLLAGGFIETENRRETIAPFVRTAGEVYLQGDFPAVAGASFRAATRRTRVHADNLLQNVNLLGYDLMLGWQHRSGLRLTAAGFYERDSGGLEARARSAGSLKALWRFRRLTMSMDFSRTRESQGSYTRDRTLAHINLRRDF